MGSRHSRHSKTAKRRLVQRGGSPVVGYDGSSIPTAYGAPFEVHARSDPYCVDPNVARPPPQLGGSRSTRNRRSKKQKGGGSCGFKQTGGSCARRQQTGGSCGLKQTGGGGSAGGVFTTVLNNDLIKMAGFAPNGCLRGGSRRKQRGGDSYRDLAATWSKPAGYGFVEAVNSNNANYSVVTPYEAMTGGKRQSRRRHH